MIEKIAAAMSSLSPEGRRDDAAHDQFQKDRADHGQDHQREPNRPDRELVDHIGAHHCCTYLSPVCPG
jgi:hypothetical protein